MLLAEIYSTYLNTVRAFQYSFSYCSSSTSDPYALLCGPLAGDQIMIMPSDHTRK